MDGLIWLALFLLGIFGAIGLSDLIIGLIRFFRHRSAVRRQLDQIRGRK